MDASVSLKDTTHKIHAKPYPGLGWRIFHILTGD